MRELTKMEIDALFQLFLNREWMKAVEWWKAREESESIHNLAIGFEARAREAARHGWAQNAIRMYCLAGFCGELAWWLNRTPGISTVQIAARCYREASCIFRELPSGATFEEGKEVKEKLRNILS